MQAIKGISGFFQREVVRGSTSKRLLFTLAIASIGACVLGLTPFQATSIGCGFTATIIAYHEYRNYIAFRRAPIPVPAGKFNLQTFSSINHVEPWHDTLDYCRAAMNLCGGVYLLTHVMIAPSILLAGLAGGSIIRILEINSHPLLHHQWIAVGISGYAARLLQSTSNPFYLYSLSGVIGYFGTSFLIKII